MRLSGFYRRSMPEPWAKTRKADRTFPPEPVPEPEPTEPECAVMGKHCPYDALIKKGANPIHQHYSSERTGGVPGSQYNERERI